MRAGKSSDGTVVRTRALGKGRLFALRTTEQIRHADDDVDDSSRADCHANHGTERPLLTRGGRSRRSRDSRSHPESREKTEPPSIDEPVFRRRGSASIAGNYTRAELVIRRRERFYPDRIEKLKQTRCDGGILLGRISMTGSSARFHDALSL